MLGISAREGADVGYHASALEELSIVSMGRHKPPNFQTHREDREQRHIDPELLPGHAYNTRAIGCGSFQGSSGQRGPTGQCSLR